MSRLVLRVPALAPLVAALALALLGAAGPTPASASPTVWGCSPAQADDPCDGSLATTTLGSTTLQPRKVLGVDTPARDADPAVDCFYVYPTVVSLNQPSAPKHLTSEVKAIYEWQASRFSQHCRMFAPIYRQATFLGLAASIARKPQRAADGTPKPDPLFALAYGDVLGAWNDYLAHDNHGRGVVLIGHSQGSAMLIRLMREQIDPNPAERNLLVSAIVPGGNLVVPRGQRTGGDLQQIPTCATGTELGCVIAYSLYASRPARSALFGRVDSTLRTSTGLPTPAGSQVACVNPAELSGDGGAFKTITRTTPFPGLIGTLTSLLYYGLAPRASTPWVVPGEHYKGSCVDNGGSNVLRVRAAARGTLLPYESPWPDWGLHLTDVNLPMGNLVDVVGQQAAAWAAAHPAG